jgi:hypothetical protein
VTRLWLGIGAFILGAVLFARARHRPDVPALLERFALGVGALGLATMASTQEGAWWSVSAISFSLIAIVLLALVLRGSMRR